MELKAMSSISLQQLSAVNDINKPVNDAKRLEKVGKDFESVFMYQVLELMQPKPNEDSMFSGGESEKIYRQILNEKIAGEISKRGGLGISKNVEMQIQKYREAIK